MNTNRMPDPTSAPGTKQGGPGPMPAETRAGLYTADESVSTFSGNPRDTVGYVCEGSCGNKVPTPNIRHS